MTAEEIVKGLTEAQKLALTVMQAYCDTDTPCKNALDLARDMGGHYDAGIAKFVAQELRKLGLVECERGLVTSNGDFYGSGWLLSRLGLEVRTLLQKGTQA